MINLDNISAWCQFLKPHQQQWFTDAFLCIIQKDFKPNETTIDDFNAGVPLSFSNGDCHIDVSREMITYEYGTRPGIRLMNELHAYEISLSVNAPQDVVRIAIAQLHNEDI